MRDIHLPSLALLLMAAAPAALAQDEAPAALDAPESAYWHAPTASWYVSSLGGGLSVERDGYGWISRFDAEGRLLQARWVEGLDAPTGIASVADRLYVADRAGLLEIDIAAARVLRTIELPGVQFANDVAAAPDGTLYVSDMAANRIYRVLPGRGAEAWLETPSLQNPNGLWVEGDTLIVATWGPLVEPGGFATHHPGTVLRVDRGDGSIAPLGSGEPVANLDGIVRVGEHYFATDWSGGRLLRFDAAGAYEVVLSGFSMLADLGYSRENHTLGLPVMGENRLVLLHLGALAEKRGQSPFPATDGG